MRHTGRRDKRESCGEAHCDDGQSAWSLQPFAGNSLLIEVKSRFYLGRMNCSAQNYSMATSRGGNRGLPLRVKADIASAVRCLAQCELKDGNIADIKAEAETAFVRASDNRPSRKQTSVT